MQFHKLNLKNSVLPIILLGGGFLASAHVNAAMVTDNQGNTGYDTAAECDAAVQAGTAQFYQTKTKHPALRQKGEVSVSQVPLSSLGAEYRLGACDIGVGKKAGRNGVSRKLQGKYVPFSAAMLVNAYSNKAGEVVRVSMKDCDNRFSAAKPRPVTLPVVAAVVVPVPVPPPAPAPVVVQAAPVAVVMPPAPAPAPVMVPKAGLTPYVFGTVGGLQDARNHDTDERVATQIGAGVQITPMLGAEVFGQWAKQHVYDTPINGQRCVTNDTFGARLTVGTNVSEAVRVFGKVGVARVHHKGNYAVVYDNTETRPTVGLGMTYGLSSALSVRADIDHYIKRSSDQQVQWKGATYVGVGLQYNF